MSEAKAEWRGVGLTVVAASFGFGIVQLDVTIVNVALPTLANALNAQTADLQWVVDSYAVSFAALLLSAGYFGDRFGARRVYLAGIVIFALASAACGLAPTSAVMIASRAAQGLGAAAMMPCSLALLNHATGHNQSLRAQAVGWWTAAGAITIAAGPVVGGFLLGLTGWRGIFLINLPVCALAALLTLQVAEIEVQSRGGFDLPGQTLAIGALTLLAASVIEARPLGMTNGQVLGMAVFGSVFSALFVVVENRREHPMLPLQLFRNATFSAAVAYGIIANLTY
jgi:DHA2 family methylenomycin A resistance protein-like MFS transporter